jgi:TonB family protein
VQLTQAVTSGDAGAVSTVIANGGDVNEKTSGGQTPLILATIFGHTHLIPLLLEAGADPQLRDNLGLNAVDWAQRRGATEVLEVLTNKPGRRSSIEARVETGTTAETRRLVDTRRAPPMSDPRERAEENHKAVAPESLSAEDKSQRWLAGLKQRIAELPQYDTSDRPNIFMRQPEPPPEIPELPKPTPEIPELPTPQPEIPKPGPDVPELPKPDLPDTPPELPKPVSPIPPQPQPEIPAEPPVTEPPTTQPPVTEPPVAQTRREAARTAARSTAPRITIPLVTEPPATHTAATDAPVALTQPAEDKPARTVRKRCPKCGAIYNSELVAYCAHHFVALVDADQPPIISDPTKTSPAMFWMIIIITLGGSLVIGSLITAVFYNSSPAQPQAATSAPATPTAIQKGTPVVGRELEGKVVSLPIAECPLNGQEAIPGTVVVRVRIDRTGQVKSATASGGDWLLRDAATEAAKKSTFAPEKLRRGETEGTITYTFEP